MFRFKYKIINPEKNIVSMRPTVPNYLLWCTPYIALVIWGLVATRESSKEIADINAEEPSDLTSVK